MKQKKNGLFTFIFSLLPGAAEMYMGFMKSGVSLMALFFLSLMIPAVLQISDVFVLVAVLIWFYSFFHARSLADCKAEELPKLPDRFVWEEWDLNAEVKISNEKLKKWSAVLLILLGVVTLWKNLSSLLYQLIPEELWMYLSPLVDQIPQVVTAVVIIILGLRMIAGKKEELDGED